MDRAAARPDFFALKPFGDLDDLGPAQYETATQANPAVRDFIEQLLRRRTVQFRGASIEGIEQDLSLITLSVPMDRKRRASVALPADGWTRLFTTMRVHVSVSGRS